MGGTALAHGPYTDLHGIRYRYCCATCKTQFEAAPDELLARARTRSGIFGVALADPVDGHSVGASSRSNSVYQGILYRFNKSANKAAFDADPGHYVLPPTSAQIGKYRVELRLPDEGLYAGEEVDVEFRVSDQTQDDPIEGKRGVANLEPSAKLTMPAMPGMPVVRPRIHREGVPGDYGLELFFPHGGEYRVAIHVAPPGGKAFDAVFPLNVADAESRKNVTAAKPFAVDVLDFPKPAKAGQPISLHVAIRDTKSGERVRSFDEAHTKLIHLIVVSKDLGWFVHAHPEPLPDGSFGMNWTFPAGGDYLIFADVAPKDRGSQVLATSVHVEGPVGTWPATLRPTVGPSRDGDVVAELRPLSRPIPVGRTTTLAFRLTDASTGKAVTNLEPYLGAQGHLMIVHQDGQVFVHSHPVEDADAAKLIRSGEVRFSARFPKPGIYKAWAQFQRGGKVLTLPFVFEVKK